jgi:hypothetical protein
MITLHTNGSGYWSRAAKAVNVVNMRTRMWIEDGAPQFGELCVYFDETWNTDKDGLIYTDDRFEGELNAFLVNQGLPKATYSEQGMQGDDYVSFDVSGEFCKAWTAKFGEKCDDISLEH